MAFGIPKNPLRMENKSPQIKRETYLSWHPTVCQDLSNFIFTATSDQRNSHPQFLQRSRPRHREVRKQSKIPQWCIAEPEHRSGFFHWHWVGAPEFSVASLYSIYFTGSVWGSECQWDKLWKRDVLLISSSQLIAAVVVIIIIILLIISSKMSGRTSNCRNTVWAWNVVPGSSSK